MSSKGSFKVKTSNTSPRRRKRVKRTNSRSITKHTKKIQIGGELASVDSIIKSSKPGEQVLKFIGGTNGIYDGAIDLPIFDATLKDNTLVKVRDNSVDKIFKYERVKNGEQKNPPGQENIVHIFQHNGFIPFPKIVVATVYDIIKDGDKIKGYKLLPQNTGISTVITVITGLETKFDGTFDNNPGELNINISGTNRECVYRTNLKVGGPLPTQNYAYLLFKRSKQNEKGNNHDNGNPNGIYQYWGEQGGSWKWINAV